MRILPGFMFITFRAFFFFKRDYYSDSFSLFIAKNYQSQTFQSLHL